MAINLDFLRSQCPRVARPKLLFFPGFWQYFSLNIVFSSISASQMTRYNKKLKNSLRKRIGSKEIGKIGNGNIFQNLTKIVVNFFGKKLYIFFLCSRPKNLVLYKSVFKQRRGKKTQISLVTYFFALNWLVYAKN